jgi:hypothetical protein
MMRQIPSPGLFNSFGPEGLGAAQPSVTQLLSQQIIEPPMAIERSEARRTSAWEFLARRARQSPVQKRKSSPKVGPASSTFRFEAFQLEQCWMGALRTRLRGRDYPLRGPRSLLRQPLGLHRSAPLRRESRRRVHPKPRNRTQVRTGHVGCPTHLNRGENRPVGLMSFRTGAVNRLATSPRTKSDSGGMDSASIQHGARPRTLYSRE